MDKLKYLQPIWWTASLILLMLHVMTKGTAKHINIDFLKVFNQFFQYADSAQGKAVWDRDTAASKQDKQQQQQAYATELWQINMSILSKEINKLWRRRRRRRRRRPVWTWPHDKVHNRWYQVGRRATCCHCQNMSAAPQSIQSRSGQANEAQPRCTLVNVAAEGQLLTARRQESQEL